MSSILFSGPKIFISNWPLGAYSGFRINWSFFIQINQIFWFTTNALLKSLQYEASLGITLNEYQK